MSNPMLEWVCEFLERDEEIVVPIRKLWHQWRVNHSAPPLDEFEAAVLADPRLEEMGGIDQGEGMEFEDAADREAFIRDMEELGFYHGPRVKLRSREITREHVARMLQEHTDKMLSALWAAHDVRPDDLPPEQEAQLMDLIAAAKQLQLQLRDAGLTSDEPLPRDNPAR